MNPAFILIVFIVLVVLWFLLSFAYRPIGKFLYRIWKDADNEINKEDENENNENGGNN